MNMHETHLLSLHDLSQPVGIVLSGERGKVHLLLLQCLIVQPQSKYTKQPGGIGQVSTEVLNPTKCQDGECSALKIPDQLCVQLW